jgi:hypothetical protein
MLKTLLIFLLTFCSVLTASSASAATPDIIGPDMEIIDNNIMVNLSIANIAELETTIKSGIEKEIVFTVELLRVWKFWPDEFVVSKKIEKTIKYDNLRERYWASSYDGINRVEKHFRDYNSMKDWICNVNEINLANLRELEPSSYYIRIVVESKSLEQLPLIGFLMLFIPEVEMSMAKESEPFIIKDNK